MSREDDIKILITEHRRRLQRLEVQEAKLGINAPPEILNEIEDVRVKIEQLQKEMEVLRRGGHKESSGDPSLPSRETAASAEEGKTQRVRRSTLPHHILIIEDDPKWYNRFQIILKNMGYEVDVAENHEEANDLLKRSNYDLVLLDVCLEGDEITVDDQLFWKSLKKEHPNMPVVMVTGRPLEPDKMWNLVQSYFSDFTDFIYKHRMDVEDFRQRIQDALRPSSE